MCRTPGDARLRVLILGGYGFFGARLARLLADIAGVETIVGGRDLAKARAVAASLSVRAGKVNPALVGSRQRRPGRSVFAALEARRRR